MNDLVTIITSAYNAEKTLQRTICSVINQTYQNIEYIVVNHGSTDGTENILLEFCQKDKRIHMLPLEMNTGFIGKALNVGLQQAAGKYVCFLDADDTYHPEFVETMLSHIQQSESMVAMCGFTMVSEKTGHVILSKRVEDRELNNFQSYHQYIKEELVKGLSFSCLDFWWNKLYRIDFLKENRILFPEDKKSLADAFFNMKIWKMHSKMIVVDFLGTNWTNSGESTSYTYKIGLKNEYLLYVNEWYAFLKDMISDKKLLIQILKNMPLVNEFYKLANSNGSKEEVLQELVLWLRDDESIYRSILKDTSLYAMFLTQIELTLCLLKNKYGIITGSDEKLLLYYNEQVLQQKSDQDFDAVFQYVFDDDNLFAVGAQTLVDYIL